MGKEAFGRILLEQGLLQAEQLEHALDLQRRRSERGDFARLGHILVELGYVTPEQVQQALQAQAISIVRCGTCHSQFNIRGFSPGRRYVCPHCRQDSLQLPEGRLSKVAVEDQLDENPTVRVGLPAREQIEDELSVTARMRRLRTLGPYQILGEIARGGMGIIYKARQPALDRVVALKTLRSEELTKPDAADRFRGEAQAVARLRHPHIVAVHEVGSADGILYFTMDFVEGVPLDRRLTQRGPLQPREAVEIVLPIAEALTYAHRKGVCHRDIKPANIILDLDGVPFLVDFGIAKRMDRMEPEEEDLLGSIPYMAPEYVEGAAYDELCDLYSLGVVLYEGLAGDGVLPYDDPDTQRLLDQIVVGEHTPIERLVPGLDPGLCAIVERMIARRERRFASMREVVVALRRWLLRDETTPVAGSARAALVVPADPLGQELGLPGTRRVPGHASGGSPLVPVLAVAALAAAALAVSGVWTARDARARLLERERQLVSERRQHREELARALLSEAVALSSNGEPTRARDLCTRVIERDGELPPTLLASAYQLRGTLRQAEGDPGAAQDLARAEALGQPPAPRD